MHNAGSVHAGARESRQCPVWLLCRLLVSAVLSSSDGFFFFCCCLMSVCLGVCALRVCVCVSVWKRGEEESGWGKCKVCNRLKSIWSQCACVRFQHIGCVFAIYQVSMLEKIANGIAILCVDRFAKMPFVSGQQTQRDSAALCVAARGRV